MANTATRPAPPSDFEQQLHRPSISNYHTNNEQHYQHYFLYLIILYSSILTLIGGIHTLLMGFVIFISTTNRFTSDDNNNLPTGHKTSKDVGSLHEPDEKNSSLSSAAPLSTLLCPTGSGLAYIFCAWLGIRVVRNFCKDDQTQPSPARSCVIWSVCAFANFATLIISIFCAERLQQELQRRRFLRGKLTAHSRAASLPLLVARTAGNKTITTAATAGIINDDLALHYGVDSSATMWIAAALFISLFMILLNCVIILSSCWLLLASMRTTANTLDINGNEINNLSSASSTKQRRLSKHAKRKWYSLARENDGNFQDQHGEYNRLISESTSNLNDMYEADDDDEEDDDETFRSDNVFEQRRSNKLPINPTSHTIAHL